MLRYLYADQLGTVPDLARAMFRDRARQFHDRLGWAVSVDETGEERDAYDAMNPLYVIWQTKEGGHGGSMRFLPTVGSTMLNDHFLHLLDGVRLVSPLIWECSRFCLSETATPRVSAALMLGGLELGLASHLSHAIGVFDARMVRIYKRLGWSPDILGTEGNGKAAISAGLWAFDPAQRAPLLDRAGIRAEQSDRWRDADLIPPSLLPQSA